MSDMLNYVIDVNVEDIIERGLKEAVMRLGRDERIISEARELLRAVTKEAIKDGKVDIEKLLGLLSITVYDSLYSAGHTIPLTKYKEILEELECLLIK